MRGSREIGFPGVVAQSVDVGGTLRGAQTIVCAYCEGGHHHLWVKKKPLPPGGIAQIGRAHGWDMDPKRGKHKCPSCKEREKMEAKELRDLKASMVKAASPSELPPRQMEPDDKRRVFRAVDEAYDEVNKRYCPEYSDARIAADLGVPRKWVETVRDENFGPHGEDPAIAEVSREIARVEASIKKLEATVFEVLAAAEKSVADLRAKLTNLIARRVS